MTNQLRRRPGRPRKDEQQQQHPQFGGEALTNAFRFLDQGEGGPSMFEGIAELLRPGDNIYELVANSRLTSRQADAVHSLMERGMRRLTKAEKEKLGKNELDYSEMPYPLRLVALFCMIRISVGGLGRHQITGAITGMYTPAPDPDSDGDGGKKGDKAEFEAPPVAQKG